ncbi:MAG: hypothetical protein LBH87_03395 [Coriobacteriales bacterium]|jgi:plasmid stability protein|nr:hypothetical protein [Coriobacteriales bacterium]
MATLIVRNVDDETKARLMQRAAGNSRSTEAEVRSILKDATAKKTWLSEWLYLASGITGSALELPKRSLPRELELFDDRQ